MPTKKHQKEMSSEPMTATRRLLAGLRDGKMADVELVGDDGVRVPALRCVLACSSPVMHNLLYSDPARANQSVIKIAGCSNKTLKALVEYCCSDELNASIWDGSCPPAEIVKDIVALARVSHAYGIPNMEERVLEGINPLMGAIPPLACVVFNYADPSTTKNIHQSALALIREKPYTCLQQEGQNVGGMVCLCPEKLKEIIRDVALQVDELFLFKQLVRWRSYNRNIYPNASAVSKQIVQYIDLTYIDPSDIKAIVLDSGLVEDRKIVEALLEQAISATKEGLAFAAMRGGTKDKKQVYAMIQGSGNPDCNGLFKQVHREGTLLCYGKIIDETRMMLLMKDSHASWKICDHQRVFYEWKSNNESHYDQFPVNGWMDVSSPAPSAGDKPVPTVKWFRPRGAGPRLPTSVPRPPPSAHHFAPPQASARIPVTSGPPGDASIANSHLSHQHIRHHQSMDENDSISSPLPTPLQSGIRSPASVGRHPASSHPSHSFHQYPPSAHPSYPASQSHPSQRGQPEDYGRHARGMTGVDAVNSPHTPVSVRVSPRTPSPRIGFHPPVKDSVSWAM